MAQIKAKPQFRLTVSAVLAYLRIPARVLADLNTSSRIEIEIDDAAAPIIAFEVQGYTIARGYASEHDGRLSAKIFWTGCQPSNRRFDPWTLKK
ncbi:MAG: hypothetical protein JOZ29_04330 [Deltaproteobacteria bacterium]|nr:hypothetical protein [Deltaproteobacteria bacterium]